MTFPDSLQVENGERRLWVRHVCGLEGDCQAISSMESGNRWPTRARDVSTGGVGLVVGRRYEPGTLLVLELLDQEGLSCMPLARVQSVRPMGYLWLLGCQWADGMTTEEFDTLVNLPVAEAV